MLGTVKMMMKVNVYKSYTVFVFMSPKVVHSSALPKSKVSKWELYAHLDSNSKGRKKVHNKINEI
jgi:hypothetical protein